MKGQDWYQADEVAEAYEDVRFSGGGKLIDRREKEAVLSAIGPIDDGQRVLEVACGTGRFTTMLASRGADIVGIDISREMLEQGRAKAADVDLDDSVEFVRGDASRLPFPDGHFDSVVAMRFFHLMDDPVPFVRELCRVSADQVFFDTFNSRSLRTLYTWLLPMGSRLYSERQVAAMLAEAGMTLAGEEHDFVLPYGFYRELPGPVAKPFRALDRLVGATVPGDYVASVSYWDARVPDAETETDGSA
ncbi:methyltransferase domain-containing protein [Halorubrum sp. CBA1125]|uniref:class I SAM-dependent methyltransferase n=1 Tax=Halorubrum sp. CBA1125 TaxID=2668072 RepID=UPI00135D1C71|nr:methyltransferase domain-containing protein [Halorubrum sp. CBA1125]MUW14980.1 methyltransferase domain-containing protein [Halorubrum sp. CBA1125]